MFSRGVTPDDKLLRIMHQEFKNDRLDNIVPQMEFFTALNLFMKRSTNATDQGYRSPCYRTDAHRHISCHVNVLIPVIPGKPPVGILP